ncbi:PREDICTED: histone H2B.3-like [Nicotiana attenuata]|uniref:Histone h2b.2 n=1 Tax=Nicotiana attenuata TaxID=49451 RepID=A0A314LC77_NICAT|nr:PREDICTED: histone H2B.3-like [Nicotiana attenuata]OIT39192.1 histone h2b.2 [Nicotiana attenuata]
MAPKKRGGRPRTTVVTARKVVEETVSVVVTPAAGETETETQTLTQSQSQPTVEILSSSTKESFDILTPPPSEEPTRKRTISVEDKSTPQRKKKEQQKEQVKQPEELEEQRAQQQDEDETQPASEPGEMPTPPKMQEEKKAQKRKPEATKKAAKAKGGTEEGGKRKRKRAKVGGGVGPSEGYRRYVFRVMKQVHPDMGISSKAMTILNNLMGDMFERIASEAATLSKYVGRATLASVDIQDAVKLVLPGELGKHAIAEGTKAVTTYVSNVGGGDKSKSKSKA